MAPSLLKTSSSVRPLQFFLKTYLYLGWICKFVLFYMRISSYEHIFSLMCAFFSESSDRHQGAGGDGGSVLHGTAEAEEDDRAPQSPTPAGFGK